jgi:hypothetical protein
LAKLHDDRLHSVASGSNKIKMSDVSCQPSAVSRQLSAFSSQLSAF